MAFLQPSLREPCCGPVSIVPHPAAPAPADSGLCMCREDLSWKELQPHLVPQEPGTAGGSLRDIGGDSDQQGAEGEACWRQPCKAASCHPACLLGWLCCCVVGACFWAHAACAVQMFASHSEPHSFRRCFLRNVADMWRQLLWWLPVMALFWLNALCHVPVHTC